MELKRTISPAFVSLSFMTAISNSPIFFFFFFFFISSISLTRKVLPIVHY